jgi:hypothetical protein
MPFVPFQDLCPEIAERETRTITVLPGAKLGLPPAHYEFVEMFCDEPGCDCRRVFLFVLSSLRQDVEAVIAWGWESLDFYKSWLGMADREMVKDLKGPVLNLCSPQTTNAPVILQLAKKFLLNDGAYVERLQRHYAMFREKIDGTQERESQRDRPWSSSAKASMGKVGPRNRRGKKRRPGRGT